MTFKQSKIGIIYTVINPTTGQYLAGIDLSENKEKLKAFNFNKKWDASRLPNDAIEEASIILIPENISFRRYEKTLEKIIENRNAVYLVLHKTNRDNTKIKIRLEKLAGLKLQHPILLEHSSKGKVFNQLLDLSNTYQERQESQFKNTLETFFQLFKFDTCLESRLALLNYYNTPESFKLLLNQIKVSKELPTSLLGIDWSTNLLQKIEELSNSSLTDLPYKKLELRKLLIPRQ